RRLRHEDRERMIGFGCFEELARLVDEAARVVDLEVEAQTAGFDAGRVEQIGHHPLEALDLPLDDRLDHLETILPDRAAARPQHRRRELERAERMAKVVRDRREERTLSLALLLERVRHRVEAPRHLPNLDRADWIPARFEIASAEAIHDLRERE